ncbi:hypothetical protein cce_3217 [Crocosphaera subtropica ATCC 51142]|uniref:Uncharacterized protein n=1 Tax=Crocosphaera subtropica (strain ATCC 51142 / BH68) TaxID=43989 RepID=B1WXM4_CROS5|nr:hypothetical protein [Crocosphaera subtropica]ACB52565.1 hypothetical protein cce_3217 [Crocosphaera subtropica ATCC 51142]
MSTTNNSESMIKAASLGSKIVKAVAPPLTEVLIDELEIKHKEERNKTQDKQRWSSK